MSTASNELRQSNLNDGCVADERTEAALLYVEEDPRRTPAQKSRQNAAVHQANDALSAGNQDKEKCLRQLGAAVAEWGNSMGMTGQVAKHFIGNCLQDSTATKSGCFSLLKELRYRRLKGKKLKLQLKLREIDEDVVAKQSDWLDGNGNLKHALETLTDSACMSHRPLRVVLRDGTTQYGAEYYDSTSKWKSWTELADNMDKERFQALFKDAASPQRVAFDACVKACLEYDKSLARQKRAGQEFSSVTRLSRGVAGQSSKRSDAAATHFPQQHAKRSKARVKTQAVMLTPDESELSDSELTEINTVAHYFSVISSAAKKYTFSKNSVLDGFEWCEDVMLGISLKLETTEALVWNGETNYTLKPNQNAWRREEDKRSFASEEYKKWINAKAAFAEVTVEFEGGYSLLKVARPRSDDEDSDGEELQYTLVHRLPPFAVVKDAQTHDLCVDWLKLRSFFSEIYQDIKHMLNQAFVYAAEVAKLPARATERESLSYRRYDPQSDELAYSNGFPVRHLPRPIPLYDFEPDVSPQDDCEYPHDGYPLCSEFRLGSRWYPYCRGTFYSRAGYKYVPFATDSDGTVRAPSGFWKPEDERILHECDYEIPDTLAPIYSDLAPSAHLLASTSQSVVFGDLPPLPPLCTDALFVGRPGD